jgi:hypothetical protein
MPRLINSLRDWNTNTFTRTLKNELEHIQAGTLPLDKGVAQGGYVDDSNVTATVLHTDEDVHTIQAKVGIFFTEIVINCGCGDTPMETNAYCVLQVSIDKTTGQAEFEVLQD